MAVGTLEVILLLARVPALHAQNAPRADSTASTLFVSVGSASENYLRYAQTLGIIPLRAWSIRPFTQTDLDAVAGKASDLEVMRGDRPVRRAGDLSWQVLPATSTIWYNSTYPFGWNDGAVWRGRGATAALEGGIAARWKALSATIDPIGFLAENRAFALMPNGTAASPYADPLFPTNIDRPQRFGDRAYARLDPGQSTIRIEGLGLTTGISTANQWTGPMSEWPYVLGNSAPGFPHLFVGSSHPLNAWIGRIHLRIFYGRLSQSEYFDAPDTAKKRFTAGLVGSFSPRIFPGLEVGIIRMFANSWPKNGIGARELRKPLEAFLKENVAGDPEEPTNNSADNQIASIFARWVLPNSGFEAYGEFGRDDHSWNVRDAIGEPDHTASYGMGLRKAWKSPRGGLVGLRGELLSFDPSALGRGRPQAGKYVHERTRQGHTERGQVLGAGFAAIDGGGVTLALDRIAPSGETGSVSLTRMVMRQRNSVPNVDVEYALAADRTRRVGHIFVNYGLTAVYEMNRYFQADAGNVMLTLGLRW